MYEDFIAKKMEYDEKAIELEILKLNLRVLCFDYEGIAGVCQWSRSTQTDEFHKTAFKINEPTLYNDPLNKEPKGDLYCSKPHQIQDLVKRRMVRATSLLSRTKPPILAHPMNEQVHVSVSVFKGRLFSLYDNTRQESSVQPCFGHVRVRV